MAHPAQSETGYWPFIWLTVLCRLFTFYFVLLLLFLLLAVGKFFVKFSFSFSVSRLLLRLGGIVFSAQKDLAEFALSLVVLSLSPCFALFWSGPRTLSKLIFTFGEDCQKYKKKQQHTQTRTTQEFSLVPLFCCCLFGFCCCYRVVVVVSVLLLLLLVVNRFALAIRILRLGLQKQIPVNSSAGSGQWDNNNNCLFLLPLLQKRCCRTQTHKTDTRTHTRIHGEQQKFLCCLCAFLYFAFALSSSLLLLLLLLLQRRTGFCFCTSLCIWFSLFRATTIKSNRERIDNWKWKRFYWI